MILLFTNHFFYFNLIMWKHFWFLRRCWKEQKRCNTYISFWKERIEQFSSATHALKKKLIIYQEYCYTSNHMTFSLGTWHDHAFEQHECWDFALSNESIPTREIHTFFPAFCTYVLGKYLFKNDLHSMDYDKHYCRFWNILIKIKPPKINGNIFLG